MEKIVIHFFLKLELKVFFSFENLQVFDDLQKMLNIAEKKTQVCATSYKPGTLLPITGTILQTTPLLRMALGLFVALATFGVGIYVL